MRKPRTQLLRRRTPNSEEEIVTKLSISGFDFTLWEGEPVAVEGCGQHFRIHDEVVTTSVAPLYCGGEGMRGNIESLRLPDEDVISRIVRVKFPHLPLALPMALNEIKLAKKGVHRIDL
jgi:hypothetical protein